MTKKGARHVCMNRMWAAHCLFDTKESTNGLWWMNRYKMKVTPKGFVATNTDALSCRGSSKKGRTRNEFYGLMGYGSAWAGVLLLLFGYEKR